MCVCVCVRLTERARARASVHVRVVEPGDNQDFVDLRLVKKGTATPEHTQLPDTNKPQKNQREKRSGRRNTKLDYPTTRGCQP